MDRRRAEAEAADEIIDEKAAAPDFLACGGEMGALIRARDWSQTPLGPVEAWSPSLRTTVSIMLANRFPHLLWWGPDYVQLYNDPYRPVLGTKHPKSMGQTGRECWPEIWQVIGPLVDTPFNGGPATWMEDISLEINRHGFVEECHFIIAYSPVPDESAQRGIGGVLATVTEITEKVVGERRITILRDLGARAAEAKTAEESCAIAAEALSKHAEDVPFALLYLIDPDGKRARLAGAAGVDMGGPASPAVVGLDDESADPSGWPLAETVKSETLQVVEDLCARFAAVPPGPWSDPPHTAAVVPIKSNIAHQLAGVLVAGVSSRLRLDGLYRSFFELAAAQIATAIANARAYEEERKRAEALAEIDRAKTLFFSNVSHEFRTPLTLMLGPLADVLAKAESGRTTDEQEPIALAYRNGLRLLKLVNSLLDFSRIEAGRAQASYEPTDLAAVTAELASNFRSACEKAGLRLVVECPSLREPIYVDRDMWEKIVLNLVSNAFKFTFEGEIAVSLRPAGETVELAVRDTGVGIPEAELPRIFERFHRVEGARGRTYEGSGIGLALVQELVKLHGGSVRVASVPGQGTTFTVAIPRGGTHLPADRIGAPRALASTTLGASAFVEEALRWLPDGGPAGLDEMPATDAPPVPSGDAAPGPAGGPARILWVDDNIDMRAYVRRILSGHYAVEAVADGAAALAAAQANPPDLVLADVMMPKLDGFGLLRALRADPRTRSLPVILLSARAGEESRVEGLEAGASDYLIKPFSAREMLARVDAQLNMTRLSRALRESEDRLRLAVEATELGTWDFDPITGAQTWSDRCKALFGLPPETTITYETFLARLHPEDRERTHQAVQKALGPAGGGAYDVEYRTIVPQDGTERWLADRGQAFFQGGRAVRFIGTVLNITERKRMEERQNLLLHELNHRVKNTLAAVQSIALQTVRNAGTLPAFRDSFNARLLALSQAHNLLTRESWRGAALREVIGEELAPYRGVHDPRFVIEGPEVRLGPKASLALGMAFHELATNAVKHGALSAPGGRIEITWTTRASDDGERLDLVWREIGGPKVRKPRRKGFGSRLIERGLAHELDGEATLDFAPSGVRCHIQIPLPRMVPME